MCLGQMMQLKIDLQIELRTETVIPAAQNQQHHGHAIAGIPVTLCFNSEINNFPHSTALAQELKKQLITNT